MAAHARSGHSLAQVIAAVFATLMTLASAVPLPAFGRDEDGPRCACVVKMACCLEGHCPLSSRSAGRGSQEGLFWNSCSSEGGGTRGIPLRTPPGVLPSPVRAAIVTLASRAPLPAQPAPREASPEVETPPPRTALPASA